MTARDNNGRGRNATIRVAEAVTLTTAAFVTILTYLMVGGAQVAEYNPVTAGIIDTAGFYAFAGVRLAAVIGTFAVIYTVHEHAHDATVRYTAVAGALVAAALTTANAASDAYATAVLGLPETVILSDVVAFSATVVVASVAWYCRTPLATGGRFAAAELRSLRTPTRRQTAAVAVAIAMVLWAPAMLTGMGGIAPQQHDGAATAAEGDVEWEHATGDIVQSSPTVADGTVYVGSYDNSVYALDAASGDVEWEHATGDRVRSSPTVADGTVYVGSDDNSVYALDAASGDVEWEHATGSDVRSSPTVVDGTVYVGSFDDSVYALDAATGDVEWEHATGDGVRPSPTVADGTVYVASFDNSVYALDAATGDVEWEYTTGGAVRSSPTVADGTVYVGPDDNSVYALDAASGDVEWEHATGDWVQSSPTVADGTVYVGSNDNSVYALDAGTGDVEWEHATGSDVRSSPTVADGTVYVGSFDDLVYALDAATGDVEWEHATGSDVRSSPTVADGTVYVASDDNSVYALDAGHNEDSMDTRVLSGTLGHHDTLLAGEMLSGDGSDGGEPVSGTVTDTDGNAIEGATVEIAGEDSATTDSAGAYELTVGEPGEYTVEVTDDGHETDSQTVDVPEGGITGVDFELRPVGSYEILDENGVPLAEDRPVTMEAYRASEHDDAHAQPVAYWDDVEPEETQQLGYMDFGELDHLDDDYVIVYRPDNSDRDDVYASRTLYVSNLEADWQVRAYPGGLASVNVGINDTTGEWPAGEVTLRAERSDDGGDGAVVDNVELTEDAVGSMDLYVNATEHDIFAVRDDGTERLLGTITDVADMSGETVVFDILHPWLEDDDELEEEEHFDAVAFMTADPTNPVVGETVQLDASSSIAHGEDNEIDSIEWSLPDGTTTTGKTAEWTPDEADGGELRQIGVTVTDAVGNSDDTTATVYVAVEDGERSGQPMANAAVVTDQPKTGETVRIEDQSSAPSDGSIDSIEWDTSGDGSYTDATGGAVELTYQNTGVQTVGVRATSATGATDTYTLTFYVAAGDEDALHFAPNPTATAAPNDPVVGEEVTFEVSARTYDATVDSYEWDLPDGSTATGETVTWTPSDTDAGGATASVTVTDSNDESGSDSVSLFVAETADDRAAPPVADIEVATDEPTVGSPVTVRDATSIADGVEVESIEWDLTGNDQFDDATGDTAEFTPTEAGIQQVGVRVTDSNGATDVFYSAFFVGGSPEELISSGPGGGDGGAFGSTGSEGAGGVPGGAPFAIGATSLVGLFALNRRTGAVPAPVMGAVGVGTAVAGLAPAATSAAIGAIPTLGWTIGAGVGIVALLQRSGVDVASRVRRGGD